MPISVLADANLLVKDVVSAVFFDLNVAGVVALYWTDEIEVEYIEHRARLRAKNEGRTDSVEDRIWAAERMTLVKRHLVPKWCLSGWTTFGDVAELEKYAALREIPDPDDVHVATAAAYLAELAGSTVVLSTHDLAGC